MLASRVRTRFEQVLESFVRSWKSIRNCVFLHKNYMTSKGFVTSYLKFLELLVWNFQYSTLAYNVQNRTVLVASFTCISHGHCHKPDTEKVHHLYKIFVKLTGKFSYLQPIFLQQSLNAYFYRICIHLKSCDAADQYQVDTWAILRQALSWAFCAVGEWASYFD